MADVYVYAPAREQGEADIFVGVNGKGYRVPRGRTVKLPEAAAQELVNGYPEAMIITEGVVGTGLGSLSDVDIATPTNGQTLVYDSTSAKWENGAGGGGGAGGVIKAEWEEADGDMVITNLTWQQMYDAFVAGKIVTIVTGATDEERTMRTMYMVGIAPNDPTVYWVLFNCYGGQDMEFDAAAVNEHPKLSMGG